MKLALGYRQDYSSNRPIETYANSIQKSLEESGHKVFPVGEGHPVDSLPNLKEDVDLVLDLDCGRNRKGEYYFQGAVHSEIEVPKAVMFIDNHGQASYFKRLAPKYDHVFYAVWARQDIFERHKSVHWCPNFTDLHWFSYKLYEDIEPTVDFGFFGSKGGLHRANPLIEICEKHGWSYDVRQCGKGHRHRWPRTQEAMANCRYLFNHGQKHDGPNLRVVESMAMKRPLLTDVDMRDGMAQLFVEGYHYVGYESYTYEDLEHKMSWIKDNPKEARDIAYHAYEEVKKNHTVHNRVTQIIRVVKK